MTATIPAHTTLPEAQIGTRPFGTTRTISAGVATTAPRVDVVGLNQFADDHQTLHDIGFVVEPGEIVAIAGGSGAGKSTLLEAIAGVRPAASGWVLVDGEELDPSNRSLAVGFVPQNDIIHTELPLRRTLEHAATLRLPAGASRAEIDATVSRTLTRVDLDGRDDVAVGDLSGGQQKRASIAAELLVDPHLFFLDEPTSGLDPATAAEVMRQLRRLAESGTTIILTTHSPTDLCKCDKIVFLAPDGHLAFVGSPSDAADYFDVDDFVDVYAQLSAAPNPASLSSDFAFSPWASASESLAMGWPRVGRKSSSLGRRSRWSQWRSLTQRNLDLVMRNKLTLAILIGSPTMVVAMMAVLFRPGTFDADQASALPAIQTLFWVAFAAFFFGVTYGLLQIVGEFAIFKRERFAGVSVTSYVASKLAVLTPLVAVVNVTMLFVLRALDRLPENSWANWASLTVTLVLISMAALSMGLLASAAVQNPAQATLALPMLCFPQVLFAGAVVPVTEMAATGRFLSFGLADRWGFESLGRTLGLDARVMDNPSTTGYVDAFTGSVASGWIVLAIITGLALAGTVATLRHRS